MNIRISERKEKDHDAASFKDFVTVCDPGSMTAAAQILYIAQPAISLAVSEMEEHYKVRLFDRISRRAYLTDSGRQPRYARHIIAF